MFNYLSCVCAVLFSIASTSHSWNADYDYQYFDDPSFSSGSQFQQPFNQFESPIHHTLGAMPGATVQCNCIKLKECPSIVTKLSTAPKPLPQNLMKNIRKIACGYAGNDPLVCCPASEVKSRRDVTTERPWIWDVKSEQKPTPNNLFNRLYADGANWNPFNFLRFNDFPHPFYPKPFNDKRYLIGKSKKYHYFDFEDPNTFRNCPPSFSRDFEMPLNFQHVRPVKNFHTMHPPMNGVGDSRHIDNQPNLIFSTSNPFLHKHPNHPKFDPHDKRSLINSQNCGVTINPRIIGGSNAQMGQFPWMARLAYFNKTSQLVSYRCSGSVISNQYVLTAAHCVTNLVDDLELIFVRLGELDSGKNLCDDRNICSEPQDYEIQSIVHHPSYDSPKYANDIALIRLHQSTNSSFISPLCLPVDNYASTNENLEGKVGIIAGWGASVVGGSSTNPSLQYLRLPIVNTNQCASSYARYSANSRQPIIIHDNQLCVQGDSSRDACQGDSGGPLMVDDITSGRYTLVGLVSFGPRTCGHSSFPGVYTRVASYIDWIYQHLRL